jgi:adenylate cyclase
MGDTVNLSSRLESLSKHYGIPIMIGERTAKAASGHFAVLELDQLQVKGKSEPERIFTVLGRADMASSRRFTNLAAMNDAMLAAYRNRDWTQALEVIIRCREAGRDFGLDAYYMLYVGRIRHLIDNPPPAQWNGISVFETK